MAGATQLPASNRTTKRIRVLMTGTLFTPDGAQRVLIRDLSRGGALVAIENEIPVHCDAIFKRGKVFAAAQIAWSRQREAGIRFYRELTAEEVDSTLQPIVVL